MKYSSSKFYSHIALWIFFLATIPSLFLIFYIVKITYIPTAFFIDASVLLLGAYLGYYQAQFKYYILPKQNLSIIIKYFILTIIYLISFLLPALYAFFMYKNHIGIGIYWYLLFIMFYSKFYRSYDLNYIEIVSWEICIIAVVIHLGAMITFGYSFIPVLFVAVITFYLFIHSQANLDALLERSQKNTPMVTSIRNNNSKWLLSVLSFIFILYPLRKPLGNLLFNLLKAILSIIGFIIRFIVGLLPNSEDTTMKAAETVQVFLQLGDESNSSHFLEIIILCFMIIMIFLLRKYILACLLDLIRLIKKYLIRLYYALFGLKSIYKDSTLFYEETIEEVTITTSSSNRTTLPNKFRWKKQFKEFLKLPNNESKYRFGFKLLLEGFKLKGVTLNTSNTPRELINTINQTSTLPSIKVTPYERIRYGNKSLEEGNLEELENILTILSER